MRDRSGWYPRLMRRRAVWLLVLLPIVLPLAALAVAGLSVSPSRVTFASRCVRTAAHASPVVIANGSPEVTDVHVQVSPTIHAQTFQLSGETARPTLAPNATMTFGVGFVPQRAGETDANAVIHYTQVEPGPKHSSTPAPVAKQTTVALAGSGIDRFIDAAPLALNFRSLRVGKDAPPQTISIFDDGDTPLTIDRLSLSGRHAGDFRIASRSGSVATDGHPVIVSIGFTPRGAGARAAQLVIRSDACDQTTLTIDLAGIGVEPDIAVLPATVALGRVVIGKNATTDMIVIDQGQAPLRVATIDLQGIDKARFSLRSLPRFPTFVQPGHHLNFTLRFDAIDVGARTATLRIKSNDPDTPILRVPLTAEGVEPAPSPTPTLAISQIPSIAPTPPHAGLHLHIGPYLAEVVVGAAVIGFFFVLVAVRRVRGIPE